MCLTLASLYMSRGFNVASTSTRAKEFSAEYMQSDGGIWAIA